MKKFISLLLVCLMVVPFGMLATTGVSADTAKTVYLSDAGDDANDGSAADKAVKTMEKAYDLLNAGGTIVISGTYTQSAHFFGCDHAHTGKITIKGADASAVYSVGASGRYFLGGDTEFTDIAIKAVGNNTWMVIGMFNNITITETVKITRVKDFILLAGAQGGTSASDRQATPKDCTVTINGGDWADYVGVARSSYGHPAGTYSPAEFDGVDITVNVGGGAVIHKFFAFSRNIGGTSADFVAKNSSSTINLGNCTIGMFFCQANVKALTSGFENGITINISKDFDISKSFTGGAARIEGTHYVVDGTNGNVFYGFSAECAYNDEVVAAAKVGKSKVVIAPEVYDAVIATGLIRADSFASVEKAGAQTPDQPGDTPSTGDMTWVVAVVAAVAVMGSAVVLKKREN